MLKTFLTAAVVVLLPAMSFAQCMGGHEQRAMSCAEGLTWDAETGACVEIAST